MSFTSIIAFAFIRFDCCDTILTLCTQAGAHERTLFYHQDYPRKTLSSQIHLCLCGILCGMLGDTCRHEGRTMCL